MVIFLRRFEMGRLKLFLLIKTILLVALFSTRAAFSQSGKLDLRFDHITVNEGLSHSDAMAVISDKQGFVWFGTNKGMDRFDGASLKNYSFDFEHPPQSLSVNRIRTLHVNDAGELYVGTENGGVNYYDRMKDQFYPINATSFPETYQSQAKALSQASISAIATDELGQIWIGTFSHGLFTLQKDSAGNFISIRHFFSEISKSNFQVNAVKADKEGKIWIGTNHGLFQAKLANVTSDNHSDYLIEANFSLDNVEVLHFDSLGNLWMGADDKVFYAASYFLADPETMEFHSIHNSYSFRDLTALLLDSFGRLWVGTSFGLYVFEKQHQSASVEHAKIPFEKANLTIFQPVDGNPISISSSRIHDIYEDKFKTIWIAASAGGINKVDLLAKQFGHIKRESHNPASIPNNYINTIYKEKDKNLLWIGTRNGFSKYNLSTHQATNYLSQKGGGDITGIDVNAIFKDKSRKFWIGTWNNGFYILNRNAKVDEIKHYDLTSSQDVKVSNSVTAFAQDNFGYIWIATSEVGLRKYTPDGHLLEVYNHSKGQVPTSNFNSLYYDTLSSTLWAGTQNAGLLKLQIEKDTLLLLKQYKNEANDTASLGINYVWPILKSSTGDFWIGTIGAGLHKLTKDSIGKELMIRYSKWLPEVDVESILEDEEGNLWIGGAGLYKFNTKTREFLKFNVDDGLQSNSFKVGAAYKDENGIMYFGGINGLNYFDPKDIKVNPNPPVVLITELRIHNDPVEIDEELNGRILLKRNISFTDKITIKATENDFSFGFVSLHFTNPEKHLFAYKLEGYQDNWIYPEKGLRNASFSNLDAGNYTFMVKATNGEGKWSENISKIEVEILPPWWETWWAYALYCIMVIAILWLLRRISVNRQELKNKLLIEKVQHEKDLELNELKLKFFTNISHELRTPLTLILGPIEDLIAAPLKLNGMRGKVMLMHKQTLKLLDLVNQLMDFRKAESQIQPLKVSNQNIINFINELFLVFYHKAEEKKIHYSLTSECENANMYFDPNKLEIVLTNLLSNAFKYTGEGKEISVSISVKGNPEEEAIFKDKELLQNYLLIKVKDCGIGMDADELEKIFDFYYQAVKSETMQVIGTGIGLSLVKEIISRHSGHISVSSQLGEGTEFTVKLPFGKNHFPSTDILSTQPALTIPYIEGNLPLSNIPAQPMHSEDIDLKDFKILIIEDNEDVLQYLNKLFSLDMRVYLARNGQEGWEMVDQVSPDLILSDIMMTPMNGLEFCKRIKSDSKTMHIPIFLLTARAAVVQELEGLELGADDYIVKPFIPKLLQARVFAMLQNVQKMRDYYHKQILLQPTDICIPDEDRSLLELSMRTVEENIEDPDFNVQVLVKKMGMSQSAYYRKMKGITGQSVVEFIRDVRLKRAAQLLRESKMRISEVAITVGLEDIKYFRKVFRQIFKMSPSEYSKQHKEQELLDQD